MQGRGRALRAGPPIPWGVRERGSVAPTIPQDLPTAQQREERALQPPRNAVKSSPTSRTRQAPWLPPRASIPAAARKRCARMQNLGRRVPAAAAAAPDSCRRCRARRSPSPTLASPFPIPRSRRHHHGRHGAHRHRRGAALLPPVRAAAAHGQEARAVAGRAGRAHPCAGARRSPGVRRPAALHGRLGPAPAAAVLRAGRLLRAAGRLVGLRGLGRAGTRGWDQGRCNPPGIATATRQLSAFPPGRGPNPRPDKCVSLPLVCPAATPWWAALACRCMRRCWPRGPPSSASCLWPRQRMGHQAAATRCVDKLGGAGRERRRAQPGLRGGA